MARIAFFTAMILVPAAAHASGLKHAENWELNRDGAWIFNFLILFGGLYWIVKRFIIPALTQRSKDIAEQIEKAEKLRMETMKSLSDIEYKVRAFEKESAEIHKEAMAEGEKIKEQIIEEARSSAKRIMEKAQAEIENETLKARARLKKETAALALKLASELIEKNVGEDDHHRIINEYVEKVGKEG